MHLRFLRLIAYIDLKIDGLNKDLEHIAGGVLDNRDATADLRNRLRRELDARQRGDD